MTNTGKTLFSIRFIALIICWTYAFPSVGLGQSSVERFLNEAPAKWAEYRKHVRGFQVNQKTWHRSAEDKQANRSLAEHLQVKRNQSGSLLFWSFESDNVCACFVKNDNYAFSLEKKKTENKWRLRNLITILTSEEAVSFLKSNLNYSKKLEMDGVKYFGPFELFKTSVISLTGQPGFKVTKVTDINRNGRSFVQIDFVCSKDEKTFRKSAWYYERGWFILDPNRFWALCEFEAQFDWPGGYVKSIGHGVQELKENKNGVPSLKSAVIHLKNTQDGKPADLDVETECTVEEREPSWEEFTLSAFGLPEPMGMPPVNRGGSQWWLWIALVAFGSVGLGVVLLIVKRRYLPRDAVQK